MMSDNRGGNSTRDQNKAFNYQYICSRRFLFIAHFLFISALHRSGCIKSLGCRLIRDQKVRRYFFTPRTNRESDIKNCLYILFDEIIIRLRTEGNH